MTDEIDRITDRINEVHSGDSKQALIVEQMGPCRMFHFKKHGFTLTVPEERT